MVRLNRLTQLAAGGFAVVWGRRRVGKSRLLVEWLRGSQGVYYVADQSAAHLQRSYFSRAVAERLPGFDQVVYPSWRIVFERLTAEARTRSWRGPIVLDEFPYLVETDQTLPSVMQNWIDREVPETGLRVVISGSSQRMMQGLVLDAAAPLFGRAAQLIKLAPLPPGEIGAALSITDAAEMVRAYATWGGIPRYWELAEPFGNSLAEAVDSLVLDPLGPLHAEPDRLLREESPPATALRPILDVVGGGAHKVSEIAARIGQQATSLSRALNRLIEMELLRRELPFGASERQTKRSLYRMADPFLRLWFKLVAPNRSFLAEANTKARRRLWSRHHDSLAAETWEELARQSVAQLPQSLVSGPWRPASRFWRGNAPEFDVVAQSESGNRVLLGEVKWSTEPFDADRLAGIYQQLRATDPPAPARTLIGAEQRCITYVVFVPRITLSERERQALPFRVVTAQDVMRALSTTDR